MSSALDSMECVKCARYNINGIVLASKLNIGARKKCIQIMTWNQTIFRIINRFFVFTRLSNVNSSVRTFQRNANKLLPAAIF